MRASRRAVLISAAVLLSAIGIFVSSSSPPPPRSWSVGDTGPGGGIIVYVDEAGFDNAGGDDTSVGAMCLIGTYHYLEMTSADVEGTFSWSDAINAAGSYSTATADDWVLPSLDALNEMCKYAFGDTENRTCNDAGDGPFSNRVGGFSTVQYWSSSEYGTGAWFQNFGTGRRNFDYEVFKRHVRPVRAF